MSILEVDCSGIPGNPHCAHGPTLKFTRSTASGKQVFYACSAYRSRKNCPFFLMEGDEITSSKQLAWHDWKERTIPKIDRGKSYQKLQIVKGLKINERILCRSCYCFVPSKDANKHSGHNIIRNLTDKQLLQPSTILNPLENNKAEAQYWFSFSSRQFLRSSIKKLKFKTVLCFGMPTIHESLRNSGIRSLLLDIDPRYSIFYSENEFCWFNMLNFFFMDNIEHQQALLKSILENDKPCALIDPPFGVRLELIAYLLSRLEELSPHKIEVILVLPYFMESQILQHLPGFEMLDYCIEYLNHRKFKSKNKVSPVRIFTNVDGSVFEMPTSEGYWKCEKCNRWRCRGNRHCDKCSSCTSRNGERYRHCSQCGKCVKSTWVHCHICRKCALPQHDCSSAKANVSGKQVKRQKLK